MRATLMAFKSAAAFAARNAVTLGALIGAMSTGAIAQAQDPTIANWTFETSVPTTAGPYSPETGVGAASALHANGSTVYSTPAGNGSPHSFSSNFWTVGDYYQFKVSTTGLNDITFGWDQTSSNTGPKDYTLEYSTNGTSFTAIESYSVLANNTPNPAWNSTTPSAIYTFAVNLTSVAALDNAPNVYFRLVDADTISANGGTVATAGTDRVDNVVVTGMLTPEPSSMVLAAIGVVGLALAAVRRKRR